MGILVHRADNFQINVDFCKGSHPSDLPLLEKSEQLGLEPHGHGIDFIQEGRVREKLQSIIDQLATVETQARQGTLMREGMKLVTDALETGWHVRTLIHAKRALEDDHLKERVEALATKVRARGGDVLIVSDKILTSITRRDNAQMVVGVLDQKLTGLNEIVAKDNDVWLALDRVRDPGNLGTIVRTADALGAKGVLLVGETTDPFALEAVRATMGSLFHLPLVRTSTEDFVTFANKWRDAFGGHVTGTHLKGAVDHRSINYAEGPQLLLMGNEQQGLTEQLAASCDQLALIAMDGAADSLNLAIATGIMLFEARRHAL